MYASLKLTNHKTTVSGQIEHLKSEVLELDKELQSLEFKKAIDEAIDVAKCSLKLAKTMCENDEEFREALKRNHFKNEERGYHADIS